MDDILTVFVFGYMFILILITVYIYQCIYRPNMIRLSYSIQNNESKRIEC